MSNNEIAEMDSRLKRLEDTLAAAIGGDFREVEVSYDDSLSAIESGLNIVLGDLRNQIETTQRLLKQQEEAISELSTPILQVWDSVLALPVIGIVDSRRSEEIMESLLGAIVETQAKYVILDITGVEVVDTKTADHFIKMVKAVNLLGSQCIMTGINPNIAQTLTTIGIDMGQINTLRNLQDGLNEVFRRMARSGRRRVKAGQNV